MVVLVAAAPLGYAQKASASALVDHTSVVLRIAARAEPLGAELALGKTSYSLYVLVWYRWGRMGRRFHSANLLK